MFTISVCDSDQKNMIHAAEQIAAAGREKRGSSLIRTYSSGRAFYEMLLDVFYTEVA